MQAQRTRCVAHRRGTQPLRLGLLVGPVGHVGPCSGRISGAGHRSRHAVWPPGSEMQGSLADRLSNFRPCCTSGSGLFHWSLRGPAVLAVRSARRATSGYFPHRHPGAPPSATLPPSRSRRSASEPIRGRFRPAPRSPRRLSRRSGTEPGTRSACSPTLRMGASGTGAHPRLEPDWRPAGRAGAYRLYVRNCGRGRTGTLQAATNLIASWPHRMGPRCSQARRPRPFHGLVAVQ